MEKPKTVPPEVTKIFHTVVDSFLSVELQDYVLRPTAEQILAGGRWSKPN
jgi:hypothetical protein